MFFLHDELAERFLFVLSFSKYHNSESRCCKLTKILRLRYQQAYIYIYIHNVIYCWEYSLGALSSVKDNTALFQQYRKYDSKVIYSHFTISCFSATDEGCMDQNCVIQIMISRAFWWGYNIRLSLRFFLSYAPVIESGVQSFLNLLFEKIQVQKIPGSQET